MSRTRNNPMADDLVRPLFNTSVWFYGAALVLATIVAVRRRSVGVPALVRHRRGGHQLAGVLGLLRHELRVLDRHQPCGHADLGDPAAGQRALAAAGDALCRGDHGVRADDWRDVPDHPPRPAVALLLARAVSERTGNLAQLPIAAGLGLLRHQHLPDRQRAVPAAADDPRLRAGARSIDGVAQARLRHAGARLAGDDEAVAPARIGHADHGDRDHPGGRVGAHHRVVRLLDGHGADVALDDLRALLRGRRHLQRYRRAHHRDGRAAHARSTSRPTCIRCTSKTLASSCCS